MIYYNNKEKVQKLQFGSAYGLYGGRRMSKEDHDRVGQNLYDVLTGANRGPATKKTKKLTFLDWYDADKGIVADYRISDELKNNLRRKKLLEMQAQGHFLDTDPETLLPINPVAEEISETKYPNISALTKEELAVINDPGPIGRMARIKASSGRDPFADFDASQAPVTVVGNKTTSPGGGAVTPVIPPLTPRDESQRGATLPPPKNKVTPEDIKETTTSPDPEEKGDDGGKGDDKDDNIVDTSGFDTAGLEGQDKFLRSLFNKKGKFYGYDEGKKKDMIKVAKWQLRNKHYTGAVDGIWGTRSDEALKAKKEEEKKKNRTEDPVVPVDPVTSNPVSIDQDYRYTDKTGDHYDKQGIGFAPEIPFMLPYFQQGGIMYGNSAGQVMGTANRLMKAKTAGNRAKMHQDATMNREMNDVARWQAANPNYNGRIDGIWGPKSQQAFYKTRQARPAIAPVPTTPSPATAIPKAQRGMALAGNNKIKYLQSLVGFNNPDGDWGDYSKNAYEDFMRRGDKTPAEKAKVRAIAHELGVQRSRTYPQDRVTMNQFNNKTRIANFQDAVSAERDSIWGGNTESMYNLMRTHKPNAPHTKKVEGMYKDLQSRGLTQ